MIGVCNKYTNYAHVFANNFKSLLTKAHLLKFLLQKINICGSNDEKTTRVFLKQVILNFLYYAR